MDKSYKEYKPEWKIGIDDLNTYRAKLKWGSPSYISEPSEAMYVFVKEKLNLSDEDFILPSDLGDDKIEYASHTRLSDDIINEFEAMLGKINVKKDVVSRVSATYGKSVYDNLRLRKKIIENIPDVVLAPVNEEQIVSILKYCTERKIPIYPSGGRTNCNKSTECLCGGICLDLMQNYNKVISFSEIDQTVTVMSGISGPQLEEFLNNISDYFSDVAYRYTLGHMPQSFEFSTVGGWVMSRSYGDNATKVGGIDDLVVSARYLTPKGIIDTADTSYMPMPDIDKLFIGSYGAFGILLSVTLKVRRYTLDGVKQFGYMFPNLNTAIKFVKEVCQGENGLPYSMQVCDPERTEMVTRMYSGNSHSLIGAFLRELHKDSERCLVMGKMMGEKPYTSMLKRFVSRSSAQFGGRNATGFINKNWERTRFNNAYVNDLLMDYGVVIDRLTCRLPWSKLEKTYYAVKEIIESRPFTFVMASVNHITAHDCSIQFEFVAKYADIDEYKRFVISVVEESRSKGIYLTAVYGMTEDNLITGTNISRLHTGLLKLVKNYLDPKNNMRPKKSNNNVSMAKNDIEIGEQKAIEATAEKIAEKKVPDKINTTQKKKPLEKTQNLSIIGSVDTGKAFNNESEVKVSSARKKPAVKLDNIAHADKVTNKASNKKNTIVKSDGIKVNNSNKVVDKNALDKASNTDKKKVSR